MTTKTSKIEQAIEAMDFAIFQLRQIINCPHSMAEFNPEGIKRDDFIVKEPLPHILKGKIIRKILISEDKDEVLFMVDGEKNIRAICKGDCSHTYIEHIEMPSSHPPFRVLDAFDITMQEIGYEISGDEYVQIYGFKILTDVGEIIIDFRNISNGHYGGSLEWTEEKKGEQKIWTTALDYGNSNENT